MDFDKMINKMFLRGFLVYYSVWHVDLSFRTRGKFKLFVSPTLKTVIYIICLQSQKRYVHSIDDVFFWSNLDCCSK